VDALTRLGISIPSAARGDSPDVVRDVRAIGLQLEAKGAFITYGTFASRPTSSVGTPGQVGRFYYATDRDALYMDTGTSWSLVAAPGAAKQYLSTNGGPIDTGPFQYSAGGNGGTGTWTIPPTPYSTNPAAQLTLAVSLNYPVEFYWEAYAGTYAGPGTQYSAMRILNPAGTTVWDFSEDATTTSFAHVRMGTILTPARLAALGAAGNWIFRVASAGDGVRTMGLRNLIMVARERPDLL
jgi:hypothetical protein